MLELEKLREKIARLEGGISKGEMVYLEVILYIAFDSGWVAMSTQVDTSGYVQTNCIYACITLCNADNDID